MGRPWAALALSVLAAAASCHGRDPSCPGPHPRCVDAPDGGPGPIGCDGGFLFCTPEPTCDPVASPGQQGCGPGSKCTWVVVQDEPESFGRTTCVPDGVVGLGQVCSRGAPGETTGFDDCIAGLICVGGTCEDICGFDGSAQATCDSGFNCTRFGDLFANGFDAPAAGVCVPGCDPVTQLRTDGTPCGPGQGCYLISGLTETSAVCASAGEVPVGAAITEIVFANSCVPGGAPRRRDSGSMTIECGGLCRPAEVTTTTNAEHEGGIAPDGCQARWGAPPLSDPTDGESCRFWHLNELFDDLSPFSNSVGWCFPHGRRQYDSDGDGTDDAPFPRCIDVTHGDVLPPIGTPPDDDARFFGCAPRPATFAAPPPSSTPALRLDRLRRPAR